MNEEGLRLLKIGVYGFIPALILAGLLGWGWGELVVLPFLIAIGLPLYNETKGIMSSANGGVMPKTLWKVMPVAFLKAQPMAWFLPFQTMAWNLKVWKLNRKPRTLKYHFKKLKPVARDSEGNILTLTSRGVVGFLTVFSWVVFWIMAQFILKFSSLDCFYFSSMLATVTLGSLIALYIRRRIRNQIVKHVPKPIWGKYAFVVYSGIFVVTVSLFLSVFAWWAGLVFGLPCVGIVYLNRIRKRGWHYNNWEHPKFNGSVGRNRPNLKFSKISLPDLDTNKYRTHLEWNETEQRFHEVYDK